MKLLTVLVNNRIDHTLNFDRRANTPNSYIAERGVGNRVNLITFLDDIRCTIHTDTRDEIRNITNIFYKTDETNNGLYTEVNVGFVVKLGAHAKHRVYGYNNTSNVTTDRQDEKTESACGSDVFKNEKFWQNGQLFLPAQDNYIYNVVIRFDIDGFEKNDFASIKINVAPREHIWDVVLDYGSEASQLIVSKRDDQDINDLSLLFEEFYKSHNNGTPPSAEDYAKYIQYDPDSERYYKSVFYIKRKFDVDLDTTSNGFRLNVTNMLGSDNDISFLNLYNQMEKDKLDYMVIPNLKIANHRGVYLPQINIGGINVTAPRIGQNDVYRKIINAFMQIAIRKTRIDGLAPRFLNIVLLVPNTYQQREVSSVLTHLSTDVMALVRDNPTAFGNIKGIEVTSVSESDASFVGVMEHVSGQFAAGGRYMIMDAGKGTLDFSVIEDRANQNANYRYNSIFRSGIIGAGNAISYAMLLSILDHLFSNELDKDKRKAKVEAFIIRNILDKNADLAEVNSLMKLVEEYKRLYNDGELSNRKVSDVNDGIKLEGLLNVLKNMIRDRIMVNDESYIDNMIVNICHSVSNRLNRSYPTQREYKIDHIFFAGRGFLMNKLRVRMEEILKSQNSDICGNATIHDFDTVIALSSTVTPKNVCMFIINGIRAGLYNGRIIGIPRIAHSATLQQAQPTDQQSSTSDKGVHDKIVNICKPIIGSIKRMFAKQNMGERGTLSQMFNTILPVANDFPDDQLSKIEAVNRNPRDLALGYSDTIVGADDRLIVSGMEYRIVLPHMNQGGVINVKLFFDGIDFVIRKEGSDGFLINTINNRALDGEFVFESTFPYLLLPPNQNESIPFPAKKEKPNPGQQLRTIAGSHLNKDEEDEQQLSRVKK
ncbi:MAG: hypothetical protein IJX40_06515 [Alistipes sp.]|nr:hypothetical protein [Alistipes sp.]MBQ8367371.1 hypothetical protein [Alistipes sp.]